MLSAKRLGLSLGILWGLSMFVMTFANIFFGYGGLWLGLLSNVYPGYDVSYLGSLIGLVYGFVDGFVGGYLVAWLYNKLSD